MILVSFSIFVNEVGTPINEGRLLFEALAAQHRVAISTNPETMPAPKLKHWIQQRGIAAHYDIRDEVHPNVPLFLRHLEIELSQGPVAMAVSTDPEDCMLAFSMGVSTLLLSTGKLIEPKKRPDGPQPWGNLVKHMEGP